jgi:hypothetical protein
VQFGTSARTIPHQPSCRSAIFAGQSHETPLPRSLSHQLLTEESGVRRPRRNSSLPSAAEEASLLRFEFWQGQPSPRSAATLLPSKGITNRLTLFHASLNLCLLPPLCEPTRWTGRSILHVALLSAYDRLLVNREDECQPLGRTRNTSQRLMLQRSLLLI